MSYFLTFPFQFVSLYIQVVLSPFNNCSSFLTLPSSQVFPVPMYVIYRTLRGGYYYISFTEETEIQENK